DVGIRDGKIAAVGKLAGARAARTIDARGRVVAPGFIDIHSHADGEDGLDSENARRRAAPNLVTQGVTTVVVNPDGGGPPSIAKQRAGMEANGIGPNAILMVGHNTVRRAVMGDDHRRAATAEEVRRMRALVRQGMEAGAFGFTAGMEYLSPGRWSTTDELVALVEEIVPFAGVYIPHQRSESSAPMWWRPSQDPPGEPTLVGAVAETIEIGERTGATVVTTHLKARGAHYWGSSRAATSLIERARARGVEVFGDQYPYNTSGSDGRAVLIPGWAAGFDDGTGSTGGGQGTTGDYAEALRRTLADPEAARKARQDIAYVIEFRGGADNIVVFEHPDPSYVGKSVAQLAAARGVPPVEMAIALQLEGYRDRPGGARLRSFSMSEEDMDAFAAPSWVATSSDAGIALPEDGAEVHARFYGTFPRKIRVYAMEHGAISVENAIRAQTSLPAQILRLRDRGLVREGFAADVVVMDLERVRDKATFTDPHQYAEGIDYVLVNGKPVVDGGSLTWALPGVVITRDGRRAPPT
ncbi:MAG: amidohydrolase family protein, partial [Gemmatimonadetes bacterium]|nr:amidohydrolase family protein [Gemmatimonadota bacterium]